MAKKVKLTQSEISEKWNRRTKNAIPDIVSGIARVTESPAQKAVAKEAKMKANLIKSIDNGAWKKGMLSVDLPTWKSKTTAKVQERLASGVDGAMDKRAKFDTYLVNTVNASLAQLEGMPDMTIEDSVNRVRKHMTFMNANKYKKA